MSRKSKALEFIEQGYDITVTGRNVQVTESMKDYAMEKIAKIDRFTDRILEVNVIMDIQKIEHRVDITIKVGHIKLQSHAVSTDMYASIDKAVDKIETQLRRYKNRIQDHQAKKVPVVDMAVNVIESVIEEDINDEIEEENRKQAESKYQFHRIVKKETLPLKTLTFDEALMKIEIAGDAFLLFRDEEDLKIKVIYKRQDGNYGVIETQS